MEPGTPWPGEAPPGEGPTGTLGHLQGEWDMEASPGEADARLIARALAAEAAQRPHDSWGSMGATGWAAPPPPEPVPSRVQGAQDHGSPNVVELSSSSSSGDERLPREAGSTAEHDEEVISAPRVSRAGSLDRIHGRASAQRHFSPPFATTGPASGAQPPVSSAVAGWLDSGEGTGEGSDDDVMIVAETQGQPPAHTQGVPKVHGIGSLGLRSLTQQQRQMLMGHVLQARMRQHLSSAAIQKQALLQGLQQPAAASACAETAHVQQQLQSATVPSAAAPGSHIGQHPMRTAFQPPWGTPRVAGSSTAAAGPDPTAMSSVLEALSFCDASREVEMEEGLLSVPLLKHQRLAVAWMEQRELSYPAGGILADDQGLGKTVSTIALIVRCHHRRNEQQRQCEMVQLDSSRLGQGSAAECIEGEGGAAHAEQLQSAVGRDATRSARASPASAAVVVLEDEEPFVNVPSTGPALQANGAAPINPEAYEPPVLAGRKRGRGAECRGPGLPNKGKATKRLPGGTLVVCPTSVLYQWEKELKAKLGPRAQDLSVLVYHGSNRMKRSAADLASFGVVLTTYSIVALDVPRAEGNKGAEERDTWGTMLAGPTSRSGAGGVLSGMRRSSSGGSLDEGGDPKQKNAGPKRGAAAEGLRGRLACISWHRIVLDEAQCIKNRTTQMAHSCWGLRAKRRWCLSGTPLQNSVDDLYSYFRFLRFAPYDDYATFRVHIKDPATRANGDGTQRLQAVLRAVMLRRTKTTKIGNEPIIQLPSRTVRLLEIEFSPEERQLYTNLEQSSKQQFDSYARSGTLRKNYMSILVMLLRLRQACNHPHLLTSNADAAKDRSPTLRSLGLPEPVQQQLLRVWEETGGLCGLCQDVAVEAPAITRCGHAFCQQCILQHLEQSDAQACPICIQPLAPSLVYPVAALRPAQEAPVMDSASGPQRRGRGKPRVPPSSKTRELIKLLLALPFVRGPPGAVQGLQPAAASAVVSGGLPMLPCSAAGDWDQKGGEGPGAVTADAAAEEPNGSAALWDGFLGSAQLGSSELAIPEERLYREKAIVFSQWSSMLDLVEAPLHDAGLSFVRLDGSMSIQERDQAVTQFTTRPEITVMLMSLKAASLGLNLVVARHVVLLDLWWNPSTEEQAIDRAHRIGQTRPVHVSRFTVKDTIEDRILELQDRKRSMVASAFGEGHDASSSGTRLSMEDITFLFRSGFDG